MKSLGTGFIAPQQIIRMIFDFYERFGNRQYGESVTELDHTLQTATLAMRSNCSESLIVDACLYDYSCLQHDEGKMLLAGV